MTYKFFFLFLLSAACISGCDQKQAPGGHVHSESCSHGASVLPKPAEHVHSASCSHGAAAQKTAEHVHSESCSHGTEIGEDELDDLLDAHAGEPVDHEAEPDGHEAEDEHENCGHDHAAPAHDHATCGHDHAVHADEEVCSRGNTVIGASRISDAALKNYGVKFGRVAYQTYTPMRTMTARVERESTEIRRLNLALGGRVLRYEVPVGTQLQPDSVLVTVDLDPIRFGDMPFVLPFLKPDPTLVWNALGAYSESKTRLRIAETESERLKKAQTVTPYGLAVESKRLIDAENEVENARNALQNARCVLSAFGYAVDAPDFKANRLPGPAEWLQALKNNRFWSPAADVVLNSLDAADRTDFWILAGLGELQARGLLSAETARRMAEHQASHTHLRETLALMLNGFSLQRIQSLCEEGYFDSPSRLHMNAVMELREILAAPGEYLAPGSALAAMSPPSGLNAVIQAYGDDGEYLRAAFLGKRPCSARFLTQDGALIGDNFHVARILQQNNESLAVVPIPDSVTNLREGMRIQLDFPTDETLSRCFVVPRAAVTDFGTDKVVILRHGAHFEQRRVVILAENAREYVLSSASDIQAGDTIALSGAFRLNLALQQASGTQKFDAHAGCSH